MNHLLAAVLGLAAVTLLVGGRAALGFLLVRSDNKRRQKMTITPLSSYTPQTEDRFAEDWQIHHGGVL